MIDSTPRDQRNLLGHTFLILNGNGSFASVDTITIRFDGNLNLVTSQNLDLDMQAIVTALNGAVSNSDIKLKAEAVGGSF